MQMDGFVLGRGPEGRCDDFRVGGAVVDHDAVSGLWRMWYYCRDRAFDSRAPGTLGSGRVALATSADGIDWTRVDGDAGHGAVFGPSGQVGDFDGVHLALTDVTRGAGEWLMWYFGGDGAPADTGSHLGVMGGIALKPGLARSQDGMNWERVRGPASGGALLEIDDGCVYAAWPAVIHDGRRMIMQYSAPLFGLKDYPARSAVSDDGVHWDKTGVLQWADGPKPWDRTGIITRQLLANPLPGGRRWLMLYTGTDDNHDRSIAVADSDDGLTWTHLYDGPIFRVGPEGAWDCKGVAATRLVAAHGRLHLYYYGFQSLADDDKPRGIGLAVTDTGDLRDLKRIDRPAA
jgi:hypothetical protein